jgi:hypothetical protein
MALIAVKRVRSVVRVLPWLSRSATRREQIGWCNTRTRRVAGFL